MSTLNVQDKVKSTDSNCENLRTELNRMHTNLCRTEQTAIEKPARAIDSTLAANDCSVPNKAAFINTAANIRVCNHLFFLFFQDVLRFM